MIERLIITGLINSTEYLQQVRSVWDGSLLVSTSAQETAQWCIEYYDEFNEAPERRIDDIYFDKKDSGNIPEDLIEDIGEDLDDLAEEFDEKFNVGYALKKTQAYFRKRHLLLHQARVDEMIKDGDEEAAEALAANYKGPVFELADDLDLSKPESLDRVESVFSKASEPLIKYSGALGEIFNDQLVRGAFVSLLASEKRGKSFWLLDMAVRATQRRNKVAFFQAGDMTEGQQIKRVASYLAKLPTLDKYTGEIFLPVADCIHNQFDTCENDDRIGKFGCFTGGEFDEPEMIREKVRKDQLIEAHQDFGEDYIPCTNCKEFKQERWGTPWLKAETITHAVTVDEAKREIKDFFQKKKRSFRISTHPNDTLTVSTMRSIMDRWERTDGFIPDVIVVDYADLLVPEKTQEFRHGQNEIWKNLRSLSQSRDCLVLTATQAGSKSYDRNLLRMQDFSEDKRKYAHVTAMFGLNQDKHSREKKMGIMRINQMVIREGEFDTTSSITVLQSLNLGRPFLDSYH